MARLSILFLLFLMGCSDNEIRDIGAGESLCETRELEVISDGKSCGMESNPFICEVLEIPEVQFIDHDAYIWSPDICGFEIGDKISFKNSNRTTTFNVVDRGHFISKERIGISCNENYEMSTLICQENEVIYVSFLNDLLGIDTLTLELRTMTTSYQNQEPGSKRNIINFFQDRTNTNIRNFWIRHFIGDDYYEQIWQSFHKELILNGDSYTDIIRYQYGAHIHAQPDFKYYLQKELGILGFEVDGELWLRE